MSTKIQRWIDLLAALLGHRMPVTFAELARDVPEYLADGSVAAGKPSASLKRMFERDKLELRELGVPIESVGEEGSDESAYRLRTKDFYLPYLSVVSERGIKEPTKVDRFGFRSLASLAFAPDELQVIVEGARRARELGDPTLAADAHSAIRKLAFDLPLGATDVPGESSVAAPVAASDPKVLAALGDALFGRKQVTFDYQAMGSGQASTRTVEPYGLFFVTGHWYLAARDVEKDALRNFRVSRISALKVNKARAGTSDYEIPLSFNLREHARSRQAWEIGDGDAFDATVELRGSSGAAMAAAALGKVVLGSDSLRQFSVRRADSFARWLLAFGGELVPVSPPEIVREYDTLVQCTRALYA
jgi:proteasome accessory factor B